jgi:hypothetical protein
MEDMRTIRFEDVEVLEALTDLMRARGVALPPKQQVALRKDGDSAALQGVAIQFTQSEMTKSFPAQIVQEALISYCRRRKVRLPMHFAKSVAILEHKVALIIRQTAKVVAMNSHLPLATAASRV